MDQYGNREVSALELREAVEAGFLTKEEARLIYWSSFPTLQRAAASAPPAIES